MRSRLAFIFRQKLKPQTFGAAITGGLLTGYLFLKHKPIIHAESPAFAKVGERNPKLPTYSMAEVAKHTTKETGYWLAYKDGVYDITAYIEDHPGGNLVLKSVGKALEACWKIFSMHDMDHVYEILEEYRIGNLPPGERETNQYEQNKITDLFQYDPERSNAQENSFIRSTKPFISETKPSVLVSSFITPVDKFFVRNHAHVPFVNMNEYKLQLTNGKSTFTLSYDDLTEKFQSHTITSALNCAGNRRYSINVEQQGTVRGPPFYVGAIGNARWTGVKLRDVLESFGLDKEGKYVQFFGLDCEAPGRCYGSTIPMSKALSSDVLIAYEMNDELLTRDHGYPLRIIVPGTIGARSVKWVNRIVVSDKESNSPWEVFNYKVMPPSVKQPQKSDFDNTPGAQETNVNSAVCYPSSNEDGNKVQVLSIEPNENDQNNRQLTIKGYAVSGGGRQIQNVQVSLDHGQTWSQAELEQASQPYMRAWSWTLWTYKVPFNELTSKPFDVVCRATDNYGNTQPHSPAAIWNVLGLMNNAWHKVTFQIDDKFLKKNR